VGDSGLQTIVGQGDMFGPQTQGRITRVIAAIFERNILEQQLAVRCMDAEGLIKGGAWRRPARRTVA